MTYFFILCTPRGTDRSSAVGAEGETCVQGFSAGAASPRFTPISGTIPVCTAFIRYRAAVFAYEERGSFFYGKEGDEKEGDIMIDSFTIDLEVTANRAGE